MSINTTTNETSNVTSLPSTLAESLEVIQRTSALILSAIETPAAAAEQSEAEADPAMAQAS